MTPRRPRLLPATVHLTVALLVVPPVISLSGCANESMTATTATDPSPTEPSPTEPSPTTAPTAGPRRLPDGLALDWQIHRGWSDMPVSGPGRDVVGIGLAGTCGLTAAVWPGPAVDRIAVTQTGPEYLHVRELLLFEEAREVTAVLDTVRERLLACPGDDDLEHVLLGHEDDQSVTLGVHYREGLGGTVWHLVAHDRMLLALADSGEASAESLRPMAAGLAAVHDEVWGRIGPDVA